MYPTTPWEPVLSPVLDGRKVREEQTGLSGRHLAAWRTLRRVYVLEEVWGVVGGRVHLRRHRRDAEQVRRKGLQAGLHLRWGSLRIQPGRLVLRMQDDGHTVVDLGYQTVRCSRKDGKGAPGAWLPIPPHTPYPRKGKRLARLQSNPVGHLALPGPLPFVKAVR